MRASNLLRLLNLAPPVQQMLMAGDLDMGTRVRCCRWTAQRIKLSAIRSSRANCRCATPKLVARGPAASGRQSPLLRVKKDKSRDLVRLEEQLPIPWRRRGDPRHHRRKARRAGEIAIAFGLAGRTERLLDKLGLAER